VRVLLDTHTLLYVLDTAAGKLSSKARDFYESAVTASVSAVSLYEIGQLVRLGRLTMTPARFAQIEQECASANINLIATQPRHYITAASLVWENRDPFDRIIMAVAMESDATLLTSDRAITAYAANHPEQLRVIW
jgi:PIN domain nuclease of toxin-antitoxin system